MWLFTKDGFISAVASDRDSKMMVVRARNREHLEKLLPEHEIVTLPNRDYGFRVFITREEFSTLVISLAESIDYTNFKNSIIDSEYHDACLDVWTAMYRYQNSPKKKGTSR